MGAEGGPPRKLRRISSPPYSVPTIPPPAEPPPSLGTSSATQAGLVPADLRLAQPDAPAGDLWTGRGSVLPWADTLNGLLRGFVPRRSRRGTCGLRLTRPGLLPFVAEARGLTITWARVPEGQFWQCLSSLLPQISFASRARTPVDLIFMDPESCADPSDACWSAWTVPVGVARALPALWSLQLPIGWRVHSQSFLHADMGGSTDARHTISVIVPVGLMANPDRPQALP